MSVKVSFRKERGKHQVTYWVGGKRKRKLFTEEIKADQFARKMGLGLQPEGESIPISDAVKRYYETESEKKSRNSKINDKRYFNLMYHYMTVERGIERIGTIELMDLEDFRDWLLGLKEYDGKEMSMGPNSVNRCMRVLRHFFKKCVRWKFIQHSPAMYLEFLVVDHKEEPKMTGEEFQAVAAWLVGSELAWFLPTFCFARLTGAAGSSIARMDWTDVDFTGRAYWILRKKGQEKKWKRTRLPMTNQIFALLVEIRNQWPAVEGFVFRDSVGNPLTADRICKVGNRAIRSAGVVGKTMYSMRHALASDMTAAGIPTEVVRQAMAHASITTTQRYAGKVDLRVIEGAINSVRGGSVVAEQGNEPRQEVAGR